MSVITPIGTSGFTNTAPISHSLEVPPQGHIEFQKRLAQSNTKYAGAKSNVLSQRSWLSSANYITRLENSDSGDMKEMAHFSDRSKDMGQSDKMSPHEKDSPVDHEELREEDKRSLLRGKGNKKNHNTWLKMV